MPLKRKAVGAERIVAATPSVGQKLAVLTTTNGTLDLIAYVKNRDKFGGKMRDQLQIFSGDVANYPTDNLFHKITIVAPKFLFFGQN
jgi:hypothetical protein